MRLPARPPDLDQVLAEMDSRQAIALVTRAGSGPVDRRGRYLHWDELRNKAPPDDLSHIEWWVTTKMARRAIARPLPLQAREGRSFRFSNVDSILESVHAIDQKAGGQLLAVEQIPAERTRYLVSSLTEEAITSSQLEGATTTRKEAKRLLSTGRPPRDRSEAMIVNNYRAMMRAKELAGSELTPHDVLDLHRIVTEGTLDEPADAGRLQRPEDDRIGVYSELDGTLVHSPPPAHELARRLDELCRFANGATGPGFLHPVVRAVVCHFMLAYDHPFSDGNGRTARAVFYWSMLSSGYWLAEFISISSILKKAPAQYTRSFLYTETDEDDLTYFVVYQLDVLRRSIDELGQYLERRIAETHRIESFVRGSDVLNHRQLDVVRRALRDPSEPVTIAEHQGRHRVTHQTARSDLLRLESLGLLEKRKRGRRFVFWPHEGMEQRLQALGD